MRLIRKSQAAAMWHATASDMYARSLQPCQNAYPGPQPPDRKQASTNPK